MPRALADQLAGSNMHTWSRLITLTIHQVPSFVASYLPDSLRSCTEAVLWVYARWLLRRFTSIITPTKTIAALLSTMTGLATNTIGYGVDLQKFRPLLPGDDETAVRQKWDLPLHVPLLLHVGRLDTDKSVERVIQAAALAMAQTEAHLLIVGDGTQRPALIKLCNSLGISDRVHFLGYVSMAEGLPELYRTANLFITASEIETQGIVLLEAAASGLPLVAVRATCVPEIVRGVNGYLAESGDLCGLGNAINVLLRNPHKAVSMGKASRASAEERKIDFTVGVHEQLYRQMLMERGAQPVDTGWHGPWERVKEWRLF
jgi:glycosyltransferase involved in cell wall biosynthesis